MTGNAARKDLPDLCEWMLGTGVRIGEALSVSWDEVDLAAGTVEIDHTLIRIKGVGLIRKTTKSRAVRHGYPREAVERLAQPDGRPGRGRRTDLERREQQVNRDEAKEFAEGLRARARELYRGSDNVVLVPGGPTGPDRVSKLRQEADILMTRAEKLDPTDTNRETAP